MENNHELFEAAKNGNLAIVNKLLEKGADPNKETINGETPLYIASQYNNPEVVEVLLEKGADPNKATTDYGETPLFIASVFNHSRVVEALLNHGANVDQAINNGSTPLYIASQEGHRELVEALLKKGADPNKARTDTGETPIQAATRPGLADFMREYDRRNKTTIGLHIFKNTKVPYDNRNIPFDPNEHRSVYDDLDASTIKDLYKYIGKKDANGNYVAGRRRKTRKSKKSKKSRKTKKSKKREKV